MYKNASRFLQHISVYGERKNGPNKGLPRRIRQVPRNIKKAFKSQKLIKGRLSEKVRGGYLVNFNGFHAFCPQSHMYPRKITTREFNELQFKFLDFLVIRVDLTSAVVSRKQAVKRNALRQIQDAFSHGKLVTGVVKGIKPYGAFIDLGGTDGLLHISEISDEWVESIKDYLKKGQTVKVRVLDIEKENGRISLSMRVLNRATLGR